MAAHVAAKTAREAEAVAAGHDPLDDLRTSWRAQIDFGLANPAVFRMLSDPARALRSPAARPASGSSSPASTGSRRPAGCG